MRAPRKLLAISLAVVVGAACPKASRRYAPAELVGAYVFAHNDEGLILGRDGTFEHCWAAKGATSEHGRWEAHDSDSAHTSVVLDHPTPNTPSAPVPLPVGSWTEEMEVQDIGGRIGFEIDPDSEGWYYLRARDGERVCPREEGH
jgi:hypothetical protein